MHVRFMSPIIHGVHKDILLHHQSLTETAELFVF